MSEQPKLVMGKIGVQTDEIEKPQSYVRNCKIISPRAQDTMLFCQWGDDVLAFLDGYVITPKEEYEKLVQAAKVSA